MSETLIRVRERLAASLADIDAALAAAQGAQPQLDLPDPKAFFDTVRGPHKDALARTLTVPQVQGFERLIGMGGRFNLPLAHMAYVLATAWWETGFAMQPVREKGGHAYLDKYDTGRLAKVLGNTPEDDDDGQLYAGRGDVQLTGRRNYELATQKLRAFGVIGATDDLILTPDLALRPDVSAAVIVIGMAEGWFSRSGMEAYLPSSGSASMAQFVKARAVVNGSNKAHDIAAIALVIQLGLTRGGWA